MNDDKNGKEQELVTSRIVNEFNRYVTQTFPQGITHCQLKETRQAFYMGAHVMLAKLEDLKTVINCDAVERLRADAAGLGKPRIKR
jgi:hypothetical protein